MLSAIGYRTGYAVLADLMLERLLYDLKLDSRDWRGSDTLDT